MRKTPLTQEAYLGEQLMTILGVSRILEAAGGKDWGENTDIQAFVPRDAVRLYEGELFRKLIVSEILKIE